MVEVRAGGEERPEREETVEPLVEPTPERRKERRENPVPEKAPAREPEKVPARIGGRRYRRQSYRALVCGGLAVILAQSTYSADYGISPPAAAYLE